MRNLLLATALTAAVALAPAGQAEAAAIITPYGTATAFQAAIPNAVVEDFNPAVSPFTTTGPATYDFGAFTVTKEYSSSNPTGSSSGNGGRWLGRPTTTLGDVFTFDRPIYAWGADIDTNVGGDGRGIVVSIVLEFVNSTTSQVVGSVGVGNNPNTGFIGFRSDTLFDTVRLLTNAPAPSGDNYALDNMRYAVPEPAGLALLGAGLLGLGMARRARRKAA